MPSLTLNASQLPNAAANATTSGSWLSTGGQALESISNSIAGAYKSRVASTNAVLAQQDAASAISAGQYDVGREQLKTAAAVGSEKAAQAGNGIDVNVGSPAAVRDATQAIGDLDASMIRYNAAKQAYGYNLQASNYRSEASMDRLATGFGIARDVGKTYASYVSGSTALANQKLLFKQTGVS